MLWNATAIKGFSIEGSDGLIGKVNDVLFEDNSWTTKWLVVHTGTWLFGRKVLLPLWALGKPDPDLRILAVKMTRQQIKDGPNVDTDLPVSRHIEADVYSYYDQNPMWRSGFSDIGIQPRGATAFMPREGRDAGPDDGDTNLRSVAEVIGYHIEATDAPIGHLEDFLIEDADWRIKYLAVDTKNWLPGKHVVIPPRVIQQIDWVSRSVYLSVDREKVKSSPSYNPEMTADGSFEDRMREHFWPTQIESDEALDFEA